MILDALKHIDQIVTGVHSVLLAGLQEGEQDGQGVATILRAGEVPVLPIMLCSA